MKTLNQVKIEYIKQVMVVCKFDRKKACEVLDISPRGLRNILNANPKDFEGFHRPSKLDREIQQLMDEMDDKVNVPVESYIGNLKQ